MKVAIVSHSDNEILKTFEIAEQLRRNGIQVEMVFSGQLGKKMKKVDRMNVPLCLILGDQEVRDSTIQIKDMKNGEQSVVSKSELVEWISQYFNKTDQG